MTPKPTSQLLMAIAVSVLFIACGGNDKKTDTTDTTSAAKTDTTKTAMPDATPNDVTAAPNNYKTIQDTLGIRIVEADYKPGDSSALHSHPDYATYALEAGMAEFTAKDGSKRTVDMKVGMETIHPAEIHSVKNVGKTEMKVLLVETTRPTGTTNFDATMDAVKIAGDHYKVIKDTMGIRILESSYKPGESSAMHSHPDLVMHVISGSTAEFTMKDGKKDKRELKAGMSMIVPADTHSVKNVGKTTAKVLLFEVNRPAK